MTNSKPHPITLDKVFFTRSVVIAIPEHMPVPDVVVQGPVNNINVVKLEGEPGRYNAQMRAVMNPTAEKSSPYSIDMECIAELRADDTLTEEEAMRAINITAHSVLYGAIREAVVWITSRQPYGPLMLGLSILQTSVPPESTTP